jgi:hypothetical protein
LYTPSFIFQVQKNSNVGEEAEVAPATTQLEDKQRQTGYKRARDNSGYVDLTDQSDSDPDVRH